MQGGKKGKDSVRKGAPASVPEPPAEPVAPPKPEYAPESSEYVCGVARISLLSLARGSTRLEFDTDIQPLTKVRGVTGLEWNSRPGNYAQAGAYVSGTIRYDCWHVTFLSVL